MWKYVIFIVILVSLLGCDGRTLDPADAKHAWLHVLYTDNLIYDEKLDETDNNTTHIFNLPDNSQITLDKFVSICYGSIALPEEEETSRTYITWAKKADYYTQFTDGTYLDTLLINVSSGFTPVVPNQVCGTVYSTNHIPVRDIKFYILQDSVFVDSITTSERGYFDVNIPFGNYQLNHNFLDPCETLDFNVDSYYDDYIIVSSIPVPKPVIYLYPEEKLEITVCLDFPHGGYITASIPDYGSGWKNLKIDPSGKIDGKYNYLFYESQNPDLFQYREEWIVSQAQMEPFFIQNLAETGFEGQEIIDFVDYWLPRFTGYSHYAIYPQYKEQLDNMVKLNISVEPDNIMRLFYIVEGRDNDNTKLIEPEIPEFEREGFFVVEWGARIRSQTKLSINK